MMNFFKKRSNSEIKKAIIKGFNKKSNSWFNDLIRPINSCEWYPITWESFYYYEKVSPFYNAVDIIASEIASIKPLIFNKQNNKFIDQHPFLEKLNNPNTNITYAKFMYQFAANFLISGNNYTIATNMPGKVDAEPLEIFLQNPKTVAILPGLNDYGAYKYTVTNSNNSIVFFRDALQFRFFNSQKNNATGEIYQTNSYNPQYGNLYGMSKARPLFYELSQFIAANTHNLSTLNKGGRLSGIVFLKTEIGQDQQDEIKKNFLATIQGAGNAGELLFMPSDFDYKEMSQTNKEMDFYKLSKEAKDRIYTTYKIPLPLVSTDTMTLSNYEIAKLTLYDNAVIPLASYIFSELNNFLMKRYDDSGNLKLSFDPREITALQPRHTQEITNIKALAVNTTNEIRGLIKYDDLSDGGDKLLVPAATSTLENIENGCQVDQNSASNNYNNNVPNNDVMNNDSQKKLFKKIGSLNGLTAKESNVIWNDTKIEK